ncbi:MAG: DUF2924 domain-containing protein [Deltaproteobacteria bacterium]|nr:DUF2924 domain-containing protein [Deltaproteobacteria bacterium]
MGKKKETRKRLGTKTAKKKTKGKKKTTKKAPAKKTPDKNIMDITIQITALETMSLGELQARYQELYGEMTRSRNKGYLKKRLAGRIQRLAEKKATKTKIAYQKPKEKKPPAKKARTDKPRDPRLPDPGTVIIKEYKDVTHEVKVLNRGFEHQGTYYKSLSRLAKEITGSIWNGFLFFGLIKRPAQVKEGAGR